MSDELKELKRLAEAATPGPWKKTMVSTCSGAWPRISCDVECAENEVPYEIADLPTSHIETEAARQSDEMVGNYLEKPHRFDINGADGYQSLNDADYIAAANPATILKLLAELAQAKADAARLDWIDRQRSDFNHGVVLGLYFVKASSGQQFHGATFRAAIDAALQSQEAQS